MFIQVPLYYRDSVILSNAKNLARCSGKVPARDPSDATLCQDDTNAVISV